MTLENEGAAMAAPALGVRSHCQHCVEVNEKRDTELTAVVFWC